MNEMLIASGLVNLVLAGQLFTLWRKNLQLERDAADTRIALRLAHGSKDSKYKPGAEFLQRLT